MTNLFTVKGRGVLILWVIILCCLLPFVILSFLGFMASDDYTLAILYRDNSFAKAQSIMYFGWAGRFASTFLSGLFVKFGMVTPYYCLPALSLLFFTGISIFFLLTSVNKKILAKNFSNTGIVLATFILLLVDLYTMADIASGIYWFSSAIVYQSAFILFLLLLSCLIRRFWAPHPRSTLLKDSLAILLIVSIVGCNEVAAVFLILFLFLIIALHYYDRRPVPRIFFLYLAAAIFTGILITLTSGVISVRHQLMNSHTSYLSVLPIIGFRAIAVFYYILKEPLFWMTAVFLFVCGVKTGADPLAAGSLNLFKGRSILIPGLGITLLLVIGTLTPVLMVSRGSLPPRSLNNLIELTILCLLTILFITGARNAGLAQSLLPARISSPVALIILSGALIASANYMEAWKSVLSGYFYHAIMEDRERLLQTAKANHQRTVTIDPYEEALKKKIRQVFPHGIFETVNGILRERPTAIYYYNEAEDPSRTYLDYYGLDKILISQAPSVH
ncbi:MAG TPA: DUF6056 family protein [Puia sp.]